MSAATSDILDLADRGGSIRLIASPNLTVEDVEEIRAAYDRRDEIVARAISREIDETLGGKSAEGFGILGYLISRSVLDIKIAVVDNGFGDLGLYHEKLGLFFDERDSFVAFDGSANESISGMASNFESINVYKSWQDVEGRAAEINRDFEDLWNDQTESLRVRSFPEAAAEKLIKAYRKAGQHIGHSSNELTKSSYGTPRTPENVTVREYQREAGDAWAHAGGRGILEMATGTGKTITALAIICRLFEISSNQGRPLVVLVTCPFTNLVDQWSEAAKDFGVTPIRCYKSATSWSVTARQAIDSVLRKSSMFVMFVCTNATLRSQAFKEILKDIPHDSLFIADEVHNLGAEVNASALPQHVQMRIGLSATPERWFDELGTSRISEYFGDSVYKLDMAKAISILKVLTPYYYFPILVTLTEDELARYLELSVQIQKAAAIAEQSREALDENGNFKLLLIRRARLLSSAENKLPALRRSLEPLRSSKHNLIYCAEGRPEGEDSESDERRTVDEALKLVGHDLRFTCDTYTSETSHERRSELLKRFTSGDLQVLLAMRCLDEGVDLPVARRAFIMASSSNPRQFIQRRGRLLRRSPNKERADITDFIVIPPRESIGSNVFSYERSLIRGELRRVIEFANLAENGPAALGELLEIRKDYNLLDTTA